MTTNNTSVFDGLQQQLPADALLTDPASLKVFECDALSSLRQMPLAVALPRNEAETATVLRYCHEHGIVIVPRGSGTSLSGGSRPIEGGLVLSMNRLDQIVAIDPIARQARVQPGVRNLAISEAAAPHGLYYAPDPSSQIACSLGGNIAENAGGVHCLKYGLTLHNVLRVRALLSDGTPIEFGSEAPDSPGLDLLPLVVGSEGMLAIVTEVTVRLRPTPPVQRVIMASFDDVEVGGDAVAAIVANGIIPAGLEMMDRKATIAAEDFVHAGYDLDAAAILLCESDGSSEEVDDEIARMVKVLESAGATRLQISKDEAERKLFWAGRKAAFPAAGRLAPDYYCMDGTVPRRYIGKLLKDIEAMQTTYGLDCINVFHAGDGNMHPLILFDASDPAQFHRAEQFGAAILERCVDYGGTITGEHGVGVEKLDSMCVQFSESERDSFHRLKEAFDPARMLNPDKAIPTLQRCAEYGRMHVHRGQLPHPDIPRF